MVGLGAMTDGVRIAPAGELKGKADQSKRGAWLKGKKSLVVWWDFSIIHHLLAAYLSTVPLSNVAF